MASTRFCIKCGKEIPIDSEFCPYCGAKQPAVSPTTDLTSSAKNKWYKHWWSWAMIMILLIGIFIGGYAIYAHHQTVKKQERIAANNASFNQIFTDFNQQVPKLGANLENLGNNVLDVWNDAIFEDSGAKVNGKYYTDFNKAIDAVYDQYNSNGKVDQIKKQYADIKTDYEQMQQLKTKDTQDKFNEVKNTYQDVKKLYTTVTNPTGTYDDFSSAFSKADNDLGADLN